MRTATVIVLGALLSGGCSLQQTLHQAGQTGAALRLEPRYQIADPPRWRLAAGSRVVVRTAHPAPQAWTAAAAQGVGRVFAVQEAAGWAGASDYVLEIHWPTPAGGDHVAAAGTRKSTAVGLFGFLEMPRLPPSGELMLSLKDPGGTSVHRFALVVRPKFWGKGWSDPAHIEAAFGEVAETLRGG